MSKLVQNGIEPWKIRVVAGCICEIFVYIFEVSELSGPAVRSREFCVGINIFINPYRQGFVCTVEWFKFNWKKCFLRKEKRKDRVVEKRCLLYWILRARDECEPSSGRVMVDLKSKWDFAKSMYKVLNQHWISYREVAR